jgi:hypothetical protein
MGVAEGEGEGVWPTAEAAKAIVAMMMRIEFFTVLVLAFLGMGC